MKILIVAFVAVFGLLLVPKNALAESNGEIMFVLDASSSMLYKDGGAETRIDRAKAALVSTLQTLPADQKVGVRVYGSNVPDTNQVDGCNDSSLISEPKTNNSANLVQQVNNVQAKGWTLMAKTLADVKNDFKGEGPKTVILLSDGVDTCNPAQVCEAAKSLAAGGTNIKVETLGLVVNNEARAQLQCIADNTGGTYYDVNDLSRLQKALASLAEKSVQPASVEGVKIRGTTDILESPALLKDVLYTDTLNGEEQLFYSFDALPKQKITVTVKSTDSSDQLDQFNFLNVKGYTKLEASKLSATGIYGESERFSRGVDTVTTVYKIDTEKQKITEPRAIAFSVSIRDSDISVPIQIQLAAEGGESPDNKTVDENTGANPNDNEDKKDDSNYLLILLPILVATIIAIAGTVASILYKKRKKQQLAKQGPQDSSDQPKL